MFWLRMLLVLALLTPSAGWCLEPEEDGIKELIRDLKDPDPQVRGDAVIQLEIIGPEARAAIPALIAAFQDEGTFDYQRGSGSGNGPVSSVAYKALHTIGLEAVPALTRTVASQTGNSRRFAICALLQFGPRARTALHEIAKIASVPNEDSDLAMLYALQEIDVEGSKAIPIMERYLSGNGLKKESLLPGQAISMFDKYLHHPKTLPVLLSALKNANPEVRGGAVMVLAKLPSLSEPIVKSIVPLLHDNQEKSTTLMSAICAYEGRRSVKYFAGYALSSHGAAGDVVVPELLAELDVPIAKDDHSNIQMILDGIPKFRKVPPGTSARVLKYYQGVVSKRRAADDEGRVNLLYDELFAVSCLARLPAQTAELTAQWQELLGSDDEYQRFEAAIILATIDPAHHPAALALVEEVIDLQTRSRGQKVNADDEQATEENEDEIAELDARRTKMFPKLWLDFLPKVALMALLTNPAHRDRCLPKLIVLLENNRFAWDNSELLEHVQRAGPKAKGLGPFCINTTLAKYYTATFVALGPDMVPLLIENARRQLRQYEAEPAKYWASTESLEVLPEFGTTAESAWPVILDYLKSSNTHFRILAFRAVEKMSGLHDKSLPELIRGLKDSRCIVRAAAASSLGLFKDHHSTVVPALIGALDDDYADVRAAALESLVKLGVDQTDARHALRKAQQDPHPYVKLLATETLEKM